MAGTTVKKAQLAGTGGANPLSSGISVDKSIPKAFFDGRHLVLGTSSIRVKAREQAVKELQSKLPFQPGDAGWLINKFIEHQYPTGGTVDLANPLDFPNGPSVWIHLLSFLVGPRYFHHPHRSSLIAACRAAEQPGAGGQAAGVGDNFTVMMMVLRPPVEEKTVRQKIPGKNTRRRVLTIGDKCPKNAIQDREEPENEELEDTGSQQILGEHGEFVEDSDQEEERAALAAERQQAVRASPAPVPSSSAAGVSRSGKDENRPASGMMRTGDPLTREEVRAAAAEREEINRLGYSGFNPMATSTTAASTSTTKRAREESVSEDQPGKAKKPDRKRSPSPKKHAGAGAKEKDEDDDEEMLV
ncbi:hypothetical protein PV11_03313 [Exophiala sideris]|uniref:Uncharacterized protein n=1 Tax=Exophiala sideris TaxID=1016849 RepID=A0A0D1XHX5_9EURO|nr:hypothetical protein PV11_03313 [Exophiala sideris]